MNKHIIMIIAAMSLLLAASGCSLIAGRDDGGNSVDLPFRLNFIESLRNQNSLRGESLREFTGGSTATAPALQRPSSVYADQFRVYVTDSASPAGVFVFERGDATVTALTSDSGDGKLLAPGGIAVDAAGVIYVSDGPQGRVLGFDRRGTLLYVLGRAQGLTSHRGLGDLVMPAGLAVDHLRNRLYVADTQAQQVKVFTTMGIHLFDMGNRGSAAGDFKFPVSVAVDRSGRVHVLDSLRKRVFVYDPEGVLLHSFSLKGAEPGQSIQPKGIAVDSDGHVYVIDSVKNNVLIFDPDGSLVLTWGRMGTLNGDFWTPVGIFIDSHDYVYIADQTNSRVQAFQYVR
jgi:DNA-binding beta-propeller fold protein YncE